jgi:hypothetical protein
MIMIIITNANNAPKICTAVVIMSFIAKLNMDEPLLLLLLELDPLELDGW